MDNSRSSLPNVDRANSTLFKRYLEEQHKSVIISNNYQQLLRPIDSTIQITHTHRQQQQHQDTYTSKLNNNNHKTVIIKRKYSNGRKPSGDTSKQRTSYTSRFMKRFQRQHKNQDTITNVQKRDGRPRFEFYDPLTTKQSRTDQETYCTCLVSSDQNGDEHHHHHHHHQSSPTKPLQVPRLSLNELFHSSSQYRRQPTQTVIVPPSSPKPIRSPLPMLPPVVDKSTRPESISNLKYPIEQNSLPSPSIEPAPTINTIAETTLLLDPPIINLSNEYWPIINDLLQEISIEMSDKPSVDIVLEIEESLAQRIYNCIVEQDDENENDTKSYSTTTNDSSALSAAQPPLNNIISHESNDLPSSPISTTTREPMNNREKFFQPIREPPTTSFNNLDRNRHSTPFNRISQQIQNETGLTIVSFYLDVRSPFAQSLFEPVNLLRTVATSNNDDNGDFNFFPSSFSFENQQNLNTNFTLFQQQDHQSNGELSATSYHHSLPLLNHLLPPRTTPINTNTSAFKPIEPANTRSTTSFALKRPQVISSSIGTNWFGQS
ncbi:unnamed protein product [Rotaria sp. Silwood2]|nr:unnamed protein product [Rotaria sp. Silwood2]